MCLVGGWVVCFCASPLTATLWASHVPGQKKYAEHPKFHGKHTAAGALEHLQHVVLGGQPFFTKPYTHTCGLLDAFLLK